MNLIRRVKNGRVHFVTSIDDKYHITGLSPDRNHGLQVTQAQGESVIQHYEDLAELRPEEAQNYGQLELMPIRD